MIQLYDRDAAVVADVMPLVAALCRARPGPDTAKPRQLYTFGRRRTSSRVIRRRSRNWSVPGSTPSSPRSRNSAAARAAYRSRCDSKRGAGVAKARERDLRQHPRARRRRW